MRCMRSTRDADAFKAAGRAEEAAQKSLDVARHQLELGSVSYLALINARADLPAGADLSARRRAPIATPIPPHCSRRSADPSLTEASASKLCMQAHREDRHRSAIAVVAGILDPLIVETEVRP